MVQFNHLDVKTIELGKMIKQRPIKDLNEQAEKLINNFKN